MLKKKAPEGCDTCINYVYDDDYDCYTCDLRLDEDELQRYAYSPVFRCPFYQYKDEYINVRKQI